MIIKERSIDTLIPKVLVIDWFQHLMQFSYSRTIHFTLSWLLVYYTHLVTSTQTSRGKIPFVDMNFIFNFKLRQANCITDFYEVNLNATFMFQSHTCIFLYVW